MVSHQDISQVPTGWVFTRDIHDIATAQVDYISSMETHYGGELVFCYLYGEYEYFTCQLWVAGELVSTTRYPAWWGFTKAIQHALRAYN